MGVKQGLKKTNLEENIQMNDRYPNDSYFSSAWRRVKAGAELSKMGSNKRTKC